MKYFVGIIFILMLFGCEPEAEVTTSENNTSIKSMLSVDAVKEYMPRQYFNEAVLIYRNVAGEERQLHTVSSETIKKRMLNGIEYKTEQFQINLYDPNLHDFSIRLIGSTNYGTNGQVSLGLSGYLMPFNETGTTWIRIKLEDDEPVISRGDDFRETYTVYDMEFKDTYVGIGKDNNQVQYSAYSELYINSNYGVVAFKDKNNDLWVLDRIVE